MSFRWLMVNMNRGASRFAIMIALVGGCSDGLTPQVVQIAVSDVPGPRGLAQTVGTWAYLISPAARAALEARARLLSDAEPRPDADRVSLADREAAAALVGVYAARGGLLVLNTQGGYTLEHQIDERRSASLRASDDLTAYEGGRWALSGGVVTLHGDGGPRRLRLAGGDDALLTDDMTFTPVAAVAAPADTQGVR